eukprot:TRINITY_DN7898_c0_g1_i1.p1 TRINITY_DN7898_c0_g1~~TRINITY_DN7898_c0_g1_i1.p1  ORF type:complete len:550 (+),score=47.12 TRINITY_DN7898_c0_g1_i1:117-1652(+)
MSTNANSPWCDSHCTEEQYIANENQLIQPVSVSKEQIEQNHNGGKELEVQVALVADQSKKRKIEESEEQKDRIKEEQRGEEEKAVKVFRLGKRVLEVPQEVVQASFEKPQVIEWKQTRKSLSVILVFEGNLQSGYTNDKFVSEDTSDNHSIFNKKGHKSADGGGGICFDQEGDLEGGLASSLGFNVEKKGRGHRKRKTLNYAQMVEGTLNLRSFEEEQAAETAKTRQDEKRQEFEDKLYKCKLEGAPHGSTCAMCHLTEQIVGLDVNKEFQQGANSSSNSALGPLIPVEGNTNYVAWVHVECARWSTDVNSQENGERSPFERITAAIRRSRLQKCGWCRESGASISCVIDSCQYVYHLKCARCAGCYMRSGGQYDNLHFVGCPNHALEAHQLALQYEAQVMKRQQMRFQVQQQRYTPSRLTDQLGLNLNNHHHYHSTSVSSTCLQAQDNMRQPKFDYVFNSGNRFQHSNKLIQSGLSVSRDNGSDYCNSPCNTNTFLDSLQSKIRFDRSKL